MAKFEVCPECEGEGYVGTLGAYTSDEFDQSFDSWDDYSDLHAASKRPCECCKGQRVVTAERLAEWDEYQDGLAEQRAEQRAGC